MAIDTSNITSKSELEQYDVTELRDTIKTFGRIKGLHNRTPADLRTLLWTRIEEQRKAEAVVSLTPDTEMIDEALKAGDITPDEAEALHEMNEVDLADIAPAIEENDEFKQVKVGAVSLPMRPRAVRREQKLDEERTDDERQEIGKRGAKAGVPHTKSRRYTDNGIRFAFWLFGTRADHDTVRMTPKNEAGEVINAAGAVSSKSSYADVSKAMMCSPMFARHIITRDNDVYSDVDITIAYDPGLPIFAGDPMPEIVVTTSTSEESQ